MSSDSPVLRRLLAAGALAVLLGAAGVALRVVDGPGARAVATTTARLTVASSPADSVLLPGAVVTGRVLLSNPGDEPVRVGSVDFAPPTADVPGCRTTGVAVAATVEPTAEAPLVIPAGGSAVLGWTAFMDLTSDDACQGAVITSTATLDGRRGGTAVVRAGELPAPGRPAGGLTTRTRAAVRWPAVPGATGYLLERSAPGAGAWLPACGSSAAPSTSTSCTDTGLTQGTAYVYRVTALAGRWRAVGAVSGPVVTQTRPS